MRRRADRRARLATVADEAAEFAVAARGVASRRERRPTLAAGRPPPRHPERLTRAPAGPVLARVGEQGVARHQPQRGRHAAGMQRPVVRHFQATGRTTRPTRLRRPGGRSPRPRSRGRTIRPSRSSCAKQSRRTSRHPPVTQSTGCRVGSGRCVHCAATAAGTARRSSASASGTARSTPGAEPSRFRIRKPITPADESVAASFVDRPWRPRRRGSRPRPSRPGSAAAPSRRPGVGERSATAAIHGSGAARDAVVHGANPRLRLNRRTETPASFRACERRDDTASDYRR